MVYAARMFAYSNGTSRALLVALALGAGSCGSATAPLQQPSAEPSAVPNARPPETPQQRERLGTGSALGESIRPPAGPAPDAGPHQQKKPSPDAGPAPAAVPVKHSRLSGRSTRFFS
jgi:hypothetical protein